MSIPAVIVIAWMFGKCAVAAVMDGKPHERPTMTAGPTFMQMAILAALLWWGGFFA